MGRRAVQENINRQHLNSNFWKSRKIQACTDTGKKAANMLHISSSAALTFFLHQSLHSCIPVAFTFKCEEEATTQHGLSFLLHIYTSVLDDKHQVHGKCVKISTDLWIQEKRVIFAKLLDCSLQLEACHIKVLLSVMASQIASGKR